MNKLDNNGPGEWTLGLRKESGTNRLAFQRFDKSEVDKRGIGCTIGVDGREKAGMKLVWEGGLDVERLVISL
jgi:hypothetical protein